MAVSTTISLSLNATESATGDLWSAAAAHVKSALIEWATGTGSSQSDVIFSDTRSAAASADAIDLKGTSNLAGVYANCTFVEVRALLIINKSTTAGQILTVGAGSNPAFAGLFAATGDAIKIPAGGVLFWAAKYDGDGLIPVATTGDILTIDPGASTISYDIVIIGTSS